MFLTFHLQKPVARWAILCLGVVLSFALLWMVYLRFLVSVLTAKKMPIPVETLAQAVSAYPSSAQLQARLADALLSLNAPDAASLGQAEAAATKAVKLSPWNANHHILLAATKGLTGDRQAQESHLRRAVALAPHNAGIRWRLANALVRAGKIEESLDEFRVVVTTDTSFLPPTLDLLWQMTEGNITQLDRVTGERTKNRLQLAQFLIKQSRVEDALQVIGRVDRQERLAAPEIGGLLNELIAAGKTDVAHQLWLELVAQPSGKRVWLWNGSFEEVSPPHLSQFEWQLRGNEYAQLTIDPYVMRTGAKSLRLDFFGRDTTRLSNEIKQMIVVRPGGRYRLMCFVKTAKLITPQGPRVVVTTTDTARVLAATNPINVEASDWQPYVLEFTAPANNAVLWVNVQRIPQAEYDDPTQGTIWFDDFTIMELP